VWRRSYWVYHLEIRTQDCFSHAICPYFNNASGGASDSNAAQHILLLSMILHWVLLVDVNKIIHQIQYLRQAPPQLVVSNCFPETFYPPSNSNMKLYVSFIAYSALRFVSKYVQHLLPSPWAYLHLIYIPDNVVSNAAKLSSNAKSA
jgi:hypothetical protein